MSRGGSADSSPLGQSRFSGSDLDFYSTGQFDPSFTAEISNKMRVPKKIRVVGGHDVERGDGHGQSEELNGNWSGHRQMEKGKQMQVPDRIIVTGQEKHMGSKALPRELQLETVVMPPDPEVIRIQTPPRSITLQNAPIPMRTENNDSSYRSEEDDETLVVESNGSHYEHGVLVNGSSASGVGGVMSYTGGIGLGVAGAGGGSTTVARRSKRHANYTGEENDEIEHLREQMSRINRRLLAVEEDTSERKERERYIVIAGLIYVAYKACSWLFKAGPPHH